MEPNFIFNNLSNLALVATIINYPSCSYLFIVQVYIFECFPISSLLDISVQKYEYGALLYHVGIIYINKLFVCMFKLKEGN